MASERNDLSDSAIHQVLASFIFNLPSNGLPNGSGWESNPPGTAKQRLNGFEDRGAHQEP